MKFFLSFSKITIPKRLSWGNSFSELRVNRNDWFRRLLNDNRESASYPDHHSHPYASVPRANSIRKPPKTGGRRDELGMERELAN